MRVNVLLNEDHRVHTAEIGEPIMCDEMPWPPEAFESSSCGLSADLEIKHWTRNGEKTIRKLCRSHAHDLVRQITEALELLDARDLSGWTGEKK